MAKHSFEFKKKIVAEYLNGNRGISYLSRKYGLGSNSQLHKWISAYREIGDEGLQRSRKKQTYSFEFKLHVVKLYLSNEVSYQELALSQGMNNPALLAKWVDDFRSVGPDALRPKTKGRKNSMESKKLKKTVEKKIEPTPLDASMEHIKHLEDENLKLRIENAYLKELRRVRLEEETLLKKQRESSTASEENSN